MREIGRVEGVAETVKHCSSSWNQTRGRSSRYPSATASASFLRLGIDGIKVDRVQKLTPNITPIH